jgi:glutamate 5-kinase
VRLVAPDGTEFARGLATYGADEASRLVGCRSADVEKILGYRMGDAIVHRDDLVLTHAGPESGEER